MLAVKLKVFKGPNLLWTTNRKYYLTVNPTRLHGYTQLNYLRFNNSTNRNSLAWQVDLRLGSHGIKHTVYPMFIFETTYINLREVSNRKRNNQTSKKDHMSHDTIHIRQLYSCIQLYHIHHISPYSSYSLYSCNCNHHISSYLDINHVFIYHHHRIFKQYISRLQPKKLRPVDLAVTVSW